jgi:hypothetical protein
MWGFEAPTPFAARFMRISLVVAQLWVWLLKDLMLAKDMPDLLALCRRGFPKKNA